MYQQPSNLPPHPSHGQSSSNNEMGRIENMFKQMMEKNSDSDAQLASHNTSIHNLEVQLGKISQALNTRPKGALPSDTVVNPKGGNNMGHTMAINTRSGKGEDEPTSSQRKIMDDEQVALEQMPGYVKFMKDLVTKKGSMKYEIIKMTHQVSAIVHSMAPKLEDPSAFTIPYTIGSADFAKAICDLGVDYEVPIILERPFLATGKSLVDVEAGELTFRVGDEKVIFHVCKSMRQPNSNEVCSFVDLVTNVIVDEASVVMNVDDTLEDVLLNCDDEEMEGYVECVNYLQGMGSYTYEPRKLSLDLENRTTLPTKPSIEEPPILELKPLPPHLWYKFLGRSSTLPVILSSCLTTVQVHSTLAVLQKRKKAIG
ncbi:uncharacterized protein [Nicotiana tomentosiformis]|uniref:uncharacterized protein n=1 Tax=Nicotiana tomentosiformis TaxID=4098 RepID=UPI00388CA258